MANTPPKTNTMYGYGTIGSSSLVPSHSSLTAGPLNKSLFTQAFELTVKTILKNPKNVSLDFEKNDLHFKVQDIDINLSSLLKKVNFSHLELGNEDSLNYFSLTKNSLPNQTFKDLTKAEIGAIKGYTGSDYYYMNNLLFKNTDALKFMPAHELKSMVLKIAFLGSGLNKLPCEHNLTSEKTYRGDKPTQDEIQERIDLINKDAGEALTDTPAFFSTTLSLNTAKAFADKALIYFDSPYGKDVSKLSYYPGEQEFLLEPSTLLWTHHEIKDGKHVFHAQKVVPLIEGKDTPTHHDIETFSKLYQWANTHGVKTDFVTPHLKSVLSNDSLESDNYLDKIRPQSTKQSLSMDDCIAASNTIVGLDTIKNETLSSPMPTDVLPDNGIFISPPLMMNELPSIIEPALLC